MTTCFGSDAWTAADVSFGEAPGGMAVCASLAAELGIGMPWAIVEPCDLVVCSKSGTPGWSEAAHDICVDVSMTLCEVSVEEDG